MAKYHIEMAHINLPLSSSEYHTFGIFWNGVNYFDKCLAMGCASDCQIFERFSSALKWIGQWYMSNGEIIHILDDFLIIAPGKDLCKLYLDRFFYICKQFGTPRAPNKTVGPVQVLTFLGLELDTIKYEARLPQEQIVKCLEHIDLILPRRKVTLKEIQMLCGLLNFATKVVVAGRPFLRRLYDLTYGNLIIESSYQKVVEMICKFGKSFCLSLMENAFLLMELGFPLIDLNFVMMLLKKLVMELFLEVLGFMECGMKSG